MLSVAIYVPELGGLIVGPRRYAAAVRRDGDGTDLVALPLALPRKHSIHLHTCVTTVCGIMEDKILNL